jgi:hypothetical protein
MRSIALLALSMILVVAGCHASNGAATVAPSVDAGLTDARQAATTGRYIPLSVGARWTWNGFDTLTGLSGVTTSIVDSLDTLSGAKAGIQAFQVTSTTLSGSTINWQQDTGTAIVRHREEFLDATSAVMSDHLYTPGKLRLDESTAHTALNAAWTETFTDDVTASSTTRAQPSTTITVTWTVEAVDESVTVPAGTFTCLRVHSVESGAGGYDSHFWYARNVGKVKESGTEVRELVGYSIP